jgi:hypothetical protein
MLLSGKTYGWGRIHIGNISGITLLDILITLIGTPLINTTSNNTCI